MPEQMPGLPRLLVIACYPPEGGGGGGVIMRSLLKEYPDESIMWLALRPDRSKRKKWYRPEVSRWIMPFYVPAKVGRLIGLAAAGRIEALLERVAVVFAQFAVRKHKPSDILVVADFFTIRSASIIINKFPARRFHLTVHDDPLITARMIGSGVNLQKLEEAFAALCRRAVTVDCVSARMALKYKTEYGIQSQIITRCAEDSYLAQLKLKAVRPKSDEINMILCGWGDCPPPWPDNLMEALRFVRNQLKVNFHVFDPKFLKYQGCGWVFFHEHMPEIEFDALLAEMDISYAPDPFTEEGRRFAAMSLSTKVVTSLCAGLPFVYHGPYDSTVGDLVREDPLLGLIVESQSPNDLAQGILAIWENYTARVAACRTFAQEHYSASVIRRKFLSRFEH